MCVSTKIHVCSTVCLHVCEFCIELGQGVVKLALLQTVQAVGPRGGGHAPVRVQQDPEASYDEDEEEN